METNQELIHSAGNVLAENKIDAGQQPAQPRAKRKYKNRLEVPRTKRRKVSSVEVADRLFNEFKRIGSLPDAAKLVGVSCAAAYAMRKRHNFDARIEEARQEAVRKSGLTLESSNLETLNMLRVVKRHLAEQANAWAGVPAPAKGEPTMSIDDLSEEIRELAKTEQLLLGGVTDRVGHKTWEEEVSDAQRSGGVN